MLLKKPRGMREARALGGGNSGGALARTMVLL
jgi:hypothetical protein